MKAKIYLTAIFLILCVGNFWAQENRMFTDEQYSSITSLAPKDKMPHVFNSQEDLDLLKNHRIIDAKNIILKGKLSMETVQKIREKIWRFENAIVEQD